MTKILTHKEGIVEGYPNGREGTVIILSIPSTSEDLVNRGLFNGPASNTAGAYLHTLNLPIWKLYPYFLDIWFENPFVFVVGMTYVISHSGPFSAYFTYSSHFCPPYRDYPIPFTFSWSLTT